MGVGAAVTVVTKVLSVKPAVWGEYPVADPVTPMGKEPPGTLEDVVHRVNVEVQSPFWGTCEGVKLYETQFVGPPVHVGSPPVTARATEPLNPFKGVTVTG